MPVTITLNDNLAAQLLGQAQAQLLSLDQWVLTILGQAAEHQQEFQTWAALNQRRFTLIRQRYTSGLNEAEERELAELQASVARALDPWDREMGKQLEHYESLAAQLSQTHD
ncbi:MAG TPA: hypothetical protein PLD20_15525 [Blastocatellia bacterium]|mgnify:CR=1 FL=1|nr:hypothetical protein [Blastocatellia bacterium]HMX28299.1 hypothetical protein [Blastocatellia bacterium]HMY75289.1 hypothetical protein [Blastocatellia bacterium]HMZ19346.1 hypothetical protein [Blastocatellia bacterium]HNG34360.1 hypothetical protein [Blastocatellia bacterium]